MITPGARLGPYEVIAPIGAGGMGEVFRARDTRLERSVAIKVLPAAFAQNAQLRLRFEREAKTISQLSHPNICTLYDVGDNYLVMELLDGETLAERIAKGALPLDQVLKIGAQIADALDRAHSAGIVHRDLKPSNVMLTKSGAKLLDFGLARTDASALAPKSSILETQQKALTEEGTVLGTYQYMAPEQLAGEEADARSDIFAFGAVLYEMVTGRRAFDGKNKTSVIAAIVSRDPVPIADIQPFTPPALEYVVRKCLSKDPDDRWQSARDIASQLRWISQTGSAAGVAAPIALRRRTRERALWMAALLTGVVASLVVAKRLHLGETPRPTYRFTIPMVDENYKLATQARLSPDGQTLYFRASPDGHLFQVYRRRLDEMSATAIEGTDSFSNYLVSSDGKSLLLVFPGAVLKRVSVSGGPPELVAEGAPGVPAMSSDGTIILGGDDRPLRRLMPNGTLQDITTIDKASGETGHTFPLMLPDGKRFLFLSEVRDENRGTVRYTLCGGTLGSKEITRIGEMTSRVEYHMGYLFYVRAGSLLAQPFDPSSFKWTGEAIPIADNVAFSSRNANAGFSVADNGTIETTPFPAPYTYATVDGSGRIVNTFIAASGLFGNRFAVLPDESRAIVQITDHRTGMSSLWLYGLKRATSTRLTDSPALETTPVITPDGSHVFYSSDVKATLDIYEAPIDGSEPPRPLIVAPNQQFASDVSRDGKWLMYWSNENQAVSKQDIWVMPLDGHAKPRPFLATAAAENQGIFSPDVKWVAYRSDTTGTDQIYVRPFPGPGAAHPISTKGGQWPHFSPDGKRIYFTDGNKLMAADFHPDGSASDPVIALEMPQLITTFEPLVGGRFFMLLQSEGGSAPPARIIAGWQPPR